MHSAINIIKMPHEEDPNWEQGQSVVFPEESLLLPPVEQKRQQAHSFRRVVIT